MVDDNGVAAGAGRGGEPADALAELELVVRGKDLVFPMLAFSVIYLCHVFCSCMRAFTYNVLVVDAVGLAPGRHDKGVVAGNHDNLVDALGLELVNLAREAGDVVDLAGRGEGAGDGDENDLFVLELCGQVPLSACLDSLCVSLSLVVLFFVL